MTLSPTERKIVVGLELEKANSIFSQIEVLQNAGFWDNIGNRIYYSLIRNCRLCVKGVTIIVIMMCQKKIFSL